jgi:hypothetical protein
MVLYQIPSLDPGRTVAVGWDPERGGYVARVDGAARAAVGGRPPVAWFGTDAERLRTVCDLRRAIRGYALIRADVLAALEADRASGAPPARPAVLAAGPLRAAGAAASRNGHPAPPADRSLRAVLLAVLALLVAAVAVAVVQAIWPNP